MAYFALVPAAGSGARMGGALPKQYLPLAGQPLIGHALATLCAHPQIERVFVVLAADDSDWDKFDWSALDEKLQVLRCGGASRAESVRNGLTAMAGASDRVEANDWVLVHDAARPCLTAAHLDALIDEVGDGCGGILAVPVADTLKRGEGGLITGTVSRAKLWQAQTPQMFRHAMLSQALLRAGASESITDEASAIEALGMQPKLVAADATNLKVTYPLDLDLAAWILHNRKI